MNREERLSAIEDKITQLKTQADEQAASAQQATDGTAFDFTSLFEPMRKYIDASDIAVCEFESRKPTRRRTS